MTLNFLKLKPLYFAISALFIIPSLISLTLFGLKPGIDFTGGSLLELQIQSQEPLSETNISQAVGDQLDISSLQIDQNTVLIRSQELTQQQVETVIGNIETQIGPTQELRFESVGPVLGQELIQKTAIAIAMATVAILFYVAYRFREIKYGVCAIIAMLHDTIIVLGAISLLGHFLNVEIDTLFVTAILTILSFSVHDTIVVYDRIRESLKVHRHANFDQVVNKSIMETMSRSINNSMTIIFMLLALFLLGGETIRWFVFTLLIGTITGTYSSTFTAAPLLTVWEKIQKKK
jgi:preprotein translocase subunit SecF